MDHLKNLLAGARGVLSSLQPRPYAVDGGFAEDRRNLRRDWAPLGAGLRQTLREDKARHRSDEPSDPR